MNGEVASALGEALLSRIEDASLNASAPPQQRWLDGWLLRFNPGKAKRARCVNAVAPGRLSLDEKLALAGAACAEAGQPLMLRLHRFSLPAGLDAALAERGFLRFDDTRVLVRPALAAAGALPLPAAPSGTEWVSLGADAFAAAVGALRGSSAAQIAAHAERLRHSPVPYRDLVLRRLGDGVVLACGQAAREAELVGLYDVHTATHARGQRLAQLLCERLLASAAHEGARVPYLQVEGDNQVARRLYARLGFAEAYAYHYRQAP